MTSANTPNTDMDKAFFDSFKDKLDVVLGVVGDCALYSASFREPQMIKGVIVDRTQTPNT